MANNLTTPDEMPLHKANLPRNSHVLSHDFGFTCSTGHLLPVFHTIMNPGEKIRLGFDFNLRTMELESAAFADLVTHVEYFFVPLQMLYQPIDNVVFDISNQYSGMFSSTTKALLPLLNFEECYGALFQNRANSAINYPDTIIPVESIGCSAIRLLDMLGFNPVPIATSTTRSSGETWFTPNVFPYQLMAYHCIYQHFYRQDNRERFNSRAYSFDQFYTQPLIGFSLFAANGGGLDFFKLHYRPLRNDYFTDVKVSPIVDVLNLNDKSSLDVTNLWLSRSLSGSNIPVLSSGTISQLGDTVNNSSPTSISNSNPSSNIQTVFGFTGASTVDNLSARISRNGSDINTANIRAMFANEKLWSITGRAKKTYDAQTLAHFGFTVPHDVKHEVTCFGHDEGKIHIGEVISTANTELSPLGEIAGKGYGSLNGKRHDFIAPCHGVVMAIFSVECVHNYEAGISKHNAVASKYDFFIPEYDHLGMQPLFSYETMYQSASSGQQTPQDIIGWQYRYEQWKRRYNRTTGAFRNSTGSLKSWIPTYAPYGGNYILIGEAGKHSNNANQESYKSFLNFPTDVNQIFLSQYQSVWSEAYEDEDDWAKIYDFDPFVVNSYIDAVLVSPMSDYSLPRLDA